MDRVEAPARGGIDSVEVARMERLLSEMSQEELARLFSAAELRDSGQGLRRAGSLAARFAAKEACLKLFPRETALGIIGPADFSVARDGYGAPQIECSPRALDVLGRYRIRSIALSLTHDRISASAVAIAEPAQTEASLTGKLLFHLCPIRRRVILDNLHRVFDATVPEAEIIRLAQAHYAHLAQLAVEFIKFSWLPAARQPALARVENIAAFLEARAQGKGVLVLTGHFGNWEVATSAGIANFPGERGRFHFVRRPLKVRWLDNLVNRRFRQAGFGVFPKRGALDAILDRLAAGDAVVFAFDQHASGDDAVRVEFFGHSAGTFRSLAIIALATGAPVLPAASWRDHDGKHVLRFEPALPLIDCDDPDEAIRLNTRAYNAALERFILRRPQQWWWVHRRWKPR